VVAVATITVHPQTVVTVAVATVEEALAILRQLLEPRTLVAAEAGVLVAVTQPENLVALVS